MISFDDFSKVALHTAHIMRAERVEGSDKLIRLELDDGGRDENDEVTPRIIVAGIGKKYAPDELEGKTIVIVANLEPRSLMGIESNGMLLAARDGEGNLSLLTTDADITPGSSVG